MWKSRGSGKIWHRCGKVFRVRGESEKRCWKVGWGVGKVRGDVGKGVGGIGKCDRVWGRCGEVLGEMWGV